ncbi:GntR family transcriptional regulator [Pontibacillus salicampi]|uniref:GntR family transcriptional regulator n=1 Tax=Pontibacillus salicampi TaxID=1449801 RepID=A0ABV6LR67_9BACI
MVHTDSPIPLHIQISTILEKEIKKGLYQEKIPSERELMERFSVSRTTVREAVSRLVQEGTLKKIHGRGTFISEKPPVHEWLSSLNSFTETVENMEMSAGSKLLFAGEETEEDIEGLFDHDDIFRIERLRYADEKPVAVEKHYYPISIGKKLSEYDLEYCTIYDLLEQELDIKLAEAEQFISSEIVQPNESKHLEVSPQSSVLKAERVITDPFGEVVEYYRAYFRPDMYVFRIKTKRMG